MRRLWIVVPLALVLLLALVWSQQRRAAFFVSGFIESHQVRLGSRVGGRVQEVLVGEGQSVRRGDPLLRLEPFDLQERLAEARARLAAQDAVLARLRAGARAEELAQARAARDRVQALLDKAVAGPRPLELEIAAQQLALAQAELEKARRDFQRLARLAEQGQAAEEELDDVTRLYAVRQAQLAIAENSLALLREGTRAEELAEARARLAEAAATLALLEAGTRAEDLAQAEAQSASARAAVQVIERQLAELTVAAPLDGVIEAIELRPGDLVAANAPVVSIADPSELWVRAYVPENRLAVQLGQRVGVRVDSYPGRTFAGHLTYIAREAEFTPSNVQTPDERSKQVFRIKATLDEGREVLRAGMAADVYPEGQP